VAAVRVRLLLLVLVPLALLTAPVVALAQAPDFRAVDDAAIDAVRTGDIPGVVVLVGRGDQTLYLRAYGWRRVVPDHVEMTTDTIFDIASLTKPLGTTLAIMSLVERGDVRLDAPLGRYLREFRSHAQSQVTIQRLLTHSAGLPAIPPPSAVKIGFPAAARALAKTPFDYPPGTGFQYSDMGFILLGEVVRRVTGLPLDRYLDRQMFKPLGLHDTGFHLPASLHDRIAPTEWHNNRLLIGEVHDPRARDLGGVAGNAGMFSTAADIARICRMLVAQGTFQGRRVLKPATVKLMWTRSTDGNGSRALGWDVTSTYARRMFPFFPPGSVMHTGYTGTAVVIDPASATYLILLTNRVHPSGGGAAQIAELRLRVAAAVGAALFQAPLPSLAAVESSSPAADAPAESHPVPAPIRTGLDVLEHQGFAPLTGAVVGLVTNQTGIDAHGRRAIDLFAGATNLRLHAIFSPEHGIGGDVDAEVPNGRDAATGKPIWSLYGSGRRPTAAMLAGLTAIVFDIQDVGVRYYTYLTTLVYVMEEAARHSIPVIVLDRPNPITGSVVEGPLMDPDLASFTAPHPIPVRTGMTIGEFAHMVAAERKIPVALTIVPLEGWERSRWFDETGLPWVNPSPNIRSVTQALLYSGVGLLEATNLSVGRGTDLPFEVVGAPWIDAYGLAQAMTTLGLHGVAFQPVVFTPTADHYAGIACGGVRLMVTDREAIRPVTVALALARVLRERYREQFRPESIQNLLVNRPTMWAFLRGEPFERLMMWADADRSNFLNRRASYLIYR
jgi:uncharacterized protein YbbC (DUF1343 family)/CubicO group peptidase (beta-lactamase class C family)